MKGKSKGYIGMIVSILGVVLYVTLFDTIMTAIGTIWETAGISNYIAFQTIIQISPAILMLGGLFAAGVVYKRSYSAVAGSGGDASGLVRMVLGILEIVLFVTIFSTVLTAFGTLYTSYGSNTTYIAFPTILRIGPAILFLGGLFAGGMTAVGGYRARKRRKALM